MTSLREVYDSFLSKILEDEYGYWTEEEVYADLYQILRAAIVRFKFPRTNLAIIDKEKFQSDLSDLEVEILSSYMVVEWLNRNIMSWEQIKPLYEERDFSQANLIDKLTNLLEVEKKKASELEGIYYRSVNRKPFNYNKLAEN